jgi:HEAT repeat protein
VERWKVAGATVHRNGIGFRLGIRQWFHVARKRQIRVALSLLLLLSGVAIYLTHREPSYKGKRLTFWLSELSPDDDSYSTAQEAIRAIGTNALPRLVEDLRRKDSAGKRKLSEWNDKLAALLGHRLAELTPASVRRARAVEAFGLLGTNAAPAISAISRNFNDREIATESAEALASIGSPALETAKNLSQSTNAVARAAAAFALSLYIRPDEVLPTLQKLATDSQPEVRVVAAHGLGVFATDPNTSVPLLVDLLKDPSLDVKRTACIALSRFGTNAAPAVAALSEVLSSFGTADFTLRQSAARALWNIGPSTTPVFIKFLADPNPQLRAIGVRYLARFQSASTNHLARLLPLLHDPDKEVRMNAVIALRMSFSPSSQILPSIVEGYKRESDQVVLSYYLLMFEQWGPAATNALPALIEKTKASPTDARTELLGAIAAIDENTAKQLGAEDWLLAMVRTAQAQRMQGTNLPRSPAVPPGFTQPSPRTAPDNKSSH